jgi:NADPH2:quinone reductase
MASSWIERPLVADRLLPLMKEIQLRTTGGPEVLETVERPLPVPRRGEVRVLAHSIGVGWPDVLLRRGIYRWMPSLPAIPGNEMAGVVDAVGEGVKNLTVGHRVLVSARELPQRGGCYSEAVCVSEDVPFLLPEPIDFDGAIGLSNFQLALALLACSAGCAVDTVLIPGAAGSVATSLAQVARHRGCHVIGTASTDAKRATALANGAHDVIGSDPRELPARVRQLTDGRGADLAFDHVGGALFTACLQTLAPFGMLVSYNVLSGPPDRELFTEMRKLLDRSLAVRTFSIHTLDGDRARRRGLMHEAIELMAAGHVRSPAIIKLPLEQAARAHELLECGNAAAKIVLCCNGTAKQPPSPLFAL